jgi:peptidoglycan/LPS O-acetylase OafA/YrhL
MTGRGKLGGAGSIQRQSRCGRHSERTNLTDDANPPRVEFAQMLRALAAGSVLLSHLAYTFWRKPKIVAGLIGYPPLENLHVSSGSIIVADFGVADLWGFFGVGLFFLISGFVIPFSIGGLSRSGFTVSRAFRIWPTYAAAFTVSLVCIALNARGEGLPVPYQLNEVAAHYLIFPRWPTLTRPIDGILWTLEIEVFFYAVCCLLMKQLRNYDSKVFLIGLIALPASHLFMTGMEAMIASGSSIYALSHWASSMLLFTSFMLIGTAFQYRHSNRLSVGTLVVIQLGLLTVFCLSWRVGVFGVQGWSGPISFLIAYLVFTAAFATRLWIARWPRRVSGTIGALALVSYPLYAVHGVLGYSIMAHALTLGTPAWMALVVAVTSVMAVAVVLHLVVEVPSQRLGKRLAANLSRREIVVQYL